eukprot:CAMPEP_0170536208 /NCGR_PEP_ID=MMETSP0209-20121228/102021_1 /TAXON_ID=665100 ORGANISM="Litonotus pictus, Strain P1" /NCGR_SAMPLE_ID=MMETSP0209 /ASSEMBLY_ACC=CAM_ASM_000301 /LENGTH=348 /DNA_ID=CAMNT_0010837549 /DNA_START=4162 /DNA_END=5207 /DNA_ORIENTATION=+
MMDLGVSVPATPLGTAMKKLNDTPTCTPPGTTKVSDNDDKTCPAVASGCTDTTKCWHNDGGNNICYGDNLPMMSSNMVALDGGECTCNHERYCLVMDHPNREADGCVAPTSSQITNFNKNEECSTGTTCSANTMEDTCYNSLTKMCIHSNADSGLSNGECKRTQILTLIAHHFDGVGLNGQYYEFSLYNFAQDMTAGYTPFLPGTYLYSLVRSEWETNFERYVFDVIDHHQQREDVRAGRYNFGFELQPPVDKNGNDYSFVAWDFAEGSCTSGHQQYTFKARIFRKQGSAERFFNNHATSPKIIIKGDGSYSDSDLEGMMGDSIGTFGTHDFTPYEVLIGAAMWSCTR